MQMLLFALSSIHRKRGEGFLGWVATVSRAGICEESVKYHGGIPESVIE